MAPCSWWDASVFGRTSSISLDTSNTRFSVSLLNCWDSMTCFKESVNQVEPVPLTTEAQRVLDVAERGRTIGVAMPGRIAGVERWAACILVGDEMSRRKPSVGEVFGRTPDVMSTMWCVWFQLWIAIATGSPIALAVKFKKSFSSHEN